MFPEHNQSESHPKPASLISDSSTKTKPIYDNESYDLDKDGKFKETKILRLRCNQLQLITGMV